MNRREVINMAPTAISPGAARLSDGGVAQAEQPVLRTASPFAGTLVIASPVGDRGFGLLVKRELQSRQRTPYRLGQWLVEDGAQFT